MKHLQFWHGSWRVRQPVPKALQAIVDRGAYLTESVRTADMREADRRALPVLAKFRAMLDDAQAALDQQQQRKRALDDLAGLDCLPVENLICRGRNVTGVLTRFHDVLGVEQPNGHVADGPVTFAPMIPKWAQFGNKGEKAVEDMTTKCGKFIAWLEQDDMAALIFEDGRDWRDEMIEDGDLSPQSISNHLKAVKALFAYVYDNKHITVGPNPMRDVKFNPGDGRKRDDFTIEERRKILFAAREAEEDIKWLTFLSHYLLARTSEIADAHTRDIVCEDGVWLMKISRKNRSKDQRIKTPPSIRKVALHSALLDEGFLAYRESVGDGPLFPMLRLDTYGKRAGQASNRTGEWLRNTVRITDPDKPFYSLRHSGITDLRVARTASGEIAVKSDIERYMTAHGKKDQHGGYGEYPARELKAAIEWVRNPLVQEDLAEAAE